jgi:NADH dehydrogenase/NADH:ubiquinone oxidoreductase subunit G
MEGGWEVAHQASCMVCMVKDVRSGQMIPSCSIFPQEGMEIDTESEEVLELRKMGIELLLSDHGARCGVCEGKEKCKLRELSLQMKAKWTRFGPLAPVGEKEQIHVCGQLYFEPAKCIRCGLCVYNSQNGFTFMYRGYDMKVVIPEENKKNINENMADLCPTGALFLRELRRDE